MSEPETLAEARRADRLSTSARELRALVDQVAGVQLRIEHLVWRLRRDGMSWSQIGSLLGVSKQAAQQRFDK